MLFENDFYSFSNRFLLPSFSILKTDLMLEYRSINIINYKFVHVFYDYYVFITKYSSKSVYWLHYLKTYIMIYTTAHLAHFFFRTKRHIHLQDTEMYLVTINTSHSSWLRILHIFTNNLSKNQCIIILGDGLCRELVLWSTNYFISTYVR